MAAMSPHEQQPEPPSGRQTEIRHGRHRAVVVEVGGGIREYQVDGHDVLDGYPVDEACQAARGLPLIPWPNRVRDGRYSWDGTDYQTALTEPEQHNAIHGFTRFKNWSLLDQAADRATLGLVLHPQIGYPFILRLAVEYRLGDDGLVVTTSATNVGAAAAPYATGAHPYLTVGTPTVDTAVLQLPGRTWLPTGDQQIPVGEETVDGSPYDFREPRPIGDTRVDYAFGDLTRDDDGRAWVRLAAPEDGRRVELWVDETYHYVEIFTGDALPRQDRRRKGLGVEPMTAPPNAFASGESVQRLEPGARTSSQWGIRVEG